MGGGGGSYYDGGRGNHGGGFDGGIGGGIGGGTGGIGGGGESRCSSLKFTAVLNSPQQNVLATLTPGDLLTVGIQSGSAIAVVVLKGSLVAGSITGQYLSEMISCMQNGYDYVAKVLSVQGGRCDVEVFCQ